MSAFVVNFDMTYAERVAAASVTAAEPSGASAAAPSGAVPPSPRRMGEMAFYRLEDVLGAVGDQGQHSSARGTRSEALSVAPVASVSTPALTQGMNSPVLRLKFVRSTSQTDVFAAPVAAVPDGSSSARAPSRNATAPIVSPAKSPLPELAGSPERRASMSGRVLSALRGSLSTKRLSTRHSVAQLAEEDEGASPRDGGVQ